MTSPQRRPAAQGSGPGVLGTAYALAAASARTAVALTLEGPTLVRELGGVMTEAARTTAELRPVVVDAVRAVPRLVALLEQVVPVVVRLEESADDDVAARVDEALTAVVRLVDVVDPLATLAGSAEALERLGSAVGDLHALGVTLPSVEARLETIDGALATTTSELQKVSPDLRTVATSIDALDDQIHVLADALTPLQGAAERVGTLVDKLPGRSHTPKVDD